MVSRIGIFARDIRFEHSVFALPFAYLGMVLAARGLPRLDQFVWITVAMVAARTLAMAANRLIDRELDRRNPRTAGRALPRGRIRPRDMAAISVAALGVFLFAAAQLNSLCLALAPLAAIVVVGYSYTKRFTAATHFVLGFADAIAPVGGWLAVKGSFSPVPIVLALAVATWIAGFDLIYACQDVEFDRANGVYSVPARYGIEAALSLSAATHIVTVIMLVALGVVAALGAPYFLGCAIATSLLAYEHRLVAPMDLSRLSVAFFNVNGYIAVVVFVFTLASLYF